MLIEDGILVRKYWFSVSQREQLSRFADRRDDPVKRWKISPMDVESVNHWTDYSRARDQMMAHTDTTVSPWYVVESEIKRNARINMMAHLLSTVDYHDVAQPAVTLPDEPADAHYVRPRVTSTPTSTTAPQRCWPPPPRIRVGGCASTSR